MKSSYTEPKLNIITFETEDIMTLSGDKLPFLPADDNEIN